MHASVFLLSGDILAQSRTWAKSTKRSLINVVVLPVIFGMLFGMPLLRPVIVHIGNASVVSGCSSPIASFNIGSRDAYVVFDSEKNLWIYQITARNQLDENAKIIGIVARKKTNAGFFNVISEKQQLAPPFSDTIEVLDATCILKITQNLRLWLKLKTKPLTNSVLSILKRLLRR